MPPASLAQHFNPPEGYSGVFGWIVGFSADAAFLNDAVERFTGLTKRQREIEGRLASALFLDRGNPQIPPTAAPGVHHFPMLRSNPLAFRLLHAKVAMLGFKSNQAPKQWRLRLLVSTGNWTRQTLEESLDLIWSCEVQSEALEEADEATRQSCTDIKAAWDFLSDVMRNFDTRLLEKARGKDEAEQVKTWIEKCATEAKGKARFLDNRKESMLDGVIRKVRGFGPIKRNYLAMGSGFYEAIGESQSASRGTRSASVPEMIVERLCSEDLLAKASARIRLTVNPDACQAIADLHEALAAKGIKVKRAATPADVFGQNPTQRRLHAKFLFSANEREDSPKCLSAWLYLGSGNLTRTGFLERAGAGLGNLEAGVVFADDQLTWDPPKNDKYAHLRCVTNVLPISWDDADLQGASLASGAPFEEPEAQFIAPPVPYLLWHPSGESGELRLPEGTQTSEIKVLDSSNNPCPTTETGGFLWREAQPREVRVRFAVRPDQNAECGVPVLDKAGRVSARKPPPLYDLDEAWWQLMDFPLPAPADDSDGDEGDEDDDADAEQARADGENHPTSKAALLSRYPIRKMMELLEKIAEQQTAIEEGNWRPWCHRLQHTLEQAKDVDVVRYFREQLRMNPLSVLREQSFRPEFAESASSNPGRHYEECLQAIETTWGVSGLPSLGDPQ